MRLSLMYVLCLSSSVRIAHIALYCKFLILHYTCIQVLCKADHANLTYLVLLSRWSSWYSFGTDHTESIFLQQPPRRSAQKTPLPTVLLRSVTAVAERCLLHHCLIAGDMFIVLLPSNGYVRRGASQQRPSLPAAQSRPSADMPQYNTAWYAPTTSFQTLSIFT
jgi:hypothetical protein